MRSLLYKLGKFLRLLLKKRAKRPHHIQLEITNRCNFSCPMCPRDQLGASAIDMPIEVARQALLGISRRASVRRITLTGWGEPLLAGSFFEVVALANSLFPKAALHFTTNGYLLDGEVIEKILLHRIESISISFEGDSSGVGHSSSQRVLENVRALVQARGKRRRPKIGFQVVLEKDDELWLKDLIDVAKRLGVDYVNIVRMDISLNSGLKRPSWEREQALLKFAVSYGRKVGVRVFSINRYSPLMRLATHNDLICPRTDDFVYIDVDGNALPCCNLRKHRFGNVAQRPLEAIWHDHKFRCFFENQAKICASCDALSIRQKSGEAHVLHGGRQSRTGRRQQTKQNQSQGRCQKD